MHWMWNFKSGKNRQYENPPLKSHKVQVYNYKFSQIIKENVISLFVLVKAVGQ